MNGSINSARSWKVQRASSVRKWRVKRHHFHHVNALDLYSSSTHDELRDWRIVGYRLSNSLSPHEFIIFQIIITNMIDTSLVPSGLLGELYDNGHAMSS